MASTVYCTLIKQAKINQSHSLLELFKLFDWLTRRQLSITNWTSGSLSVSSRFELLSTGEKNNALKARFFNSLTRLIRT